MKISQKIFSLLVGLALSSLAALPVAQGQPGTKLDTLECHIIGFHVGPMFPSAQGSKATLPDGSVSRDATMSSLYSAPYLDFGINALYKYKSNWLITLDGNIWFGDDNLNNRVERIPLYTRDSIIIGTNGTDANVTCYNRGISLQAGIGKVIPLMPKKNPNSGLLLHLAGGPMLQQTVFMINDVNAPQIDDDYALLYDHQRRGWILTEGLGYWFMSNNLNLVNFSVSFEVSQCWSHSTRDYIIDNHLGLNGKDSNKYFDLIYSLKFCWMFPLKGKTARDYYYY